MVVYTILVASNFFDRVISFFGNWKRFRFQSEADDSDGFDPSGIMILQKGKPSKEFIYLLLFLNTAIRLYLCIIKKEDLFMHYNICGS